MHSLTQREQQQLNSLLQKLQPGFLPLEIFLGIARLLVTSTYLVVPLYQEDSDIYVYLTRREESDVQWPNKLQLPGKVILPTDGDIQATHDRLVSDEMHGCDIGSMPTFVGYVFDQIPRGKEISIINYVILNTRPRAGELHDVYDLPNDLIDTERKRIDMAVKKFNEDHSK